MANKHQKRYCRQVSRLLPCGLTHKRMILSRIGEMVSSYLEDHPGADYSEIVDVFGEPEQVAVSYIQEQDEKAVLHRLNIGKRLVAIVTAVAGVVVLMWGAVIAAAVVKHEFPGEGYAKVYITEYDEEQGGTDRSETSDYSDDRVHVSDFSDSIWCESD